MVKRKHTRERDALVKEFCDPQMMVNQSIRIAECTECQGQGNQNGVQITRVADGWTWWCYRCERGGKVWDIGMSPVDSLKRLEYMRQQMHKKSQKNVSLPDDFTTDIPSAFLHWLWGYELDGDDVIEHNLGYSPSFHRLIVPVYISGIYGDKAAKGRMWGWTGRNIGKETKTNPKWHTVKEFGTKYIYFAVADPSTKVLVLVEDVISAMKIVKMGLNAVAVLTTWVPNELYIGLRPYDIRVWLDPDAVGKSMEIVRKFQAFGCTAKHIGYHADPKDCPKADIMTQCGT